MTGGSRAGLRAGRAREGCGQGGRVDCEPADCGLIVRQLRVGRARAVPPSCHSATPRSRHAVVPYTVIPPSRHAAATPRSRHAVVPHTVIPPSRHAAATPKSQAWLAPPALLRYICVLDFIFTEICAFRALIPVGRFRRMAGVDGAFHKTAGRVAWLALP